MTKLSAEQERLLKTIEVTKQQCDLVLEQQARDAEIKAHGAKLPVIVAVQAARVGGVPFSRISKEGLGFAYPAKSQAWLAPPAEPEKLVVPPPETEDAPPMQTGVTRDAYTGAYMVPFEGTLYEVPAIGSDADTVSEADSSVPQQVYDMIKEAHPTWVLLELD